MTVISQVHIVNRALAMLGSVQRINNIDEGTSVADSARDLWPIARDELTADHPWNHAIARATLNEGAADEFGKATYALPANCLRWLPWAKGQEHYFDADNEGGLLIAESGLAPKIRYIRRHDEVSRWPPHFQSAMAARMAMELAEPITQSTSIVEDMRVKYEGSDGRGGALARAKYADGLATAGRDRGEPEVQSRWLDAADRTSFCIPWIGT